MQAVSYHGAWARVNRESRAVNYRRPPGAVEDLTAFESCGLD
jgi:hypothetical protein